MIKQAGILLTLCATSLVVINIRTLETVERSGRGIDDDDPDNAKDDYAVRSGFFAVPLLESSRARFVVRRLAERVKTDEANRESAGEGGGAAPETPGLHFQIRAQIRVLTRVSRGPAPKNSSVGGWGDCSPSTEPPFLV